MGAFVFNNEVFETWLNTKSQEILSKVDRDRITTEEMIVLVLKAQTNHFHHMDHDFRKEFSRIDQQFKEVRNQFKEVQGQFKEVQNQFKEVQNQFKEVHELFKGVDRRFEAMERKIDDRFDRLYRFLMWQGGVIMALFSGIYLKLFLG
jgi:peptidoglycan hydrolase CwlO-like protein